MTTTTETPRTDACPHCGAEIYSPPTFASAITYYACGTEHCPDSGDSRGQDCYEKSLCREREDLQKAKAEVERLKANLRRAVEIAKEMETALWGDRVNLHAELDQLKATLNQDKK